MLIHRKKHKQNMNKRAAGWPPLGLERPGCDRHGLASKLTSAILLCPWERHFMAFSPAW